MLFFIVDVYKIHFFSVVKFWKANELVSVLGQSEEKGGKWKTLQSWSFNTDRQKFKHVDDRQVAFPP